jgi:zinc/manganese transport system substrate-binding protein
MSVELRLNLRPRLHLALPWLLASLLAACSGPAGTNAPSVVPSAGGGQLPSAGASQLNQATPARGGAPIMVLGTENFYADLLAEIGGERVQATSFLNDPNADPHEFESSPQDAATVADSKLVIVNGLGYDDFMQQLLGASPNSSRVVINVQQLLGLSSDVNVHVWYDPATMPTVAVAAQAALASLEPANAPYFAAREQAYISSLAPIATEVASLKSQFGGTPIAFTENVAGYLTDKIGLVVKTPQGFMKAIEEGTDPAPADVAAERDLFTSHSVKVLLYNSQVTSPATQGIHDLAQQNAIPIVGVAETIPPPYQTFASWQVGQLEALGQALGQP